MICQDSFTAFEKEDDPFLDLFFRTNRYSSKEYVTQLVEKCWNINPLNTMKTIFYLRDCRGGKGEKRIFLWLCQWLWSTHPLSLQKCIHLIPHYGSFKDLKKLLDYQEELTEILIPFWCQVLTEDYVSKDITFAAKYVPIQDSRFCKELGLTHKEFRLMIRDLRDRLQDVDQPIRWKEVGHLSSIVFRPNKRNWRKYLNPWKKTKKIGCLIGSTCSSLEATLSILVSELSSNHYRQLLVYKNENLSWKEIKGLSIHDRIQDVIQIQSDIPLITPKMISDDMTLVVITHLSWEKVVCQMEYKNPILIWNPVEKCVDVCPCIVSNVTLVKGIHDTFLQLFLENGWVTGKEVFDRVIHSSRYNPIP